MLVQYPRFNVFKKNLEMNTRYSSKSPSSSFFLPLAPAASLRIGILIPCVAKHLLNGVLSTTPGNFFALYTVKTSEKHAAKTGALPVLRMEFWFEGFPLGVVDGGPTLTKERRSLRISCQS